MNWRNLLIRTLTGVVLVWLMLTCVASENGWYFALWAVIGVISLIEFYGLTQKNRAKISGQQMIYNAVGTIYIVLPLALLCTLYAQWQYVVVLLTVVWSNDVGAYAVGSLIGRHPLAPKMSPKKSWEGAFAGLVVAVAVALMWWNFYFQGLTSPTDSSITAKLIWACMGAVIAVGAVAGDLIESKFKRKLGVKDSGKILAGHGGMLDRFDALLFATLLFWLYLKIILPLLQN